MPLVFGRSILGLAVADTGVTWTNPDLSSASYDSVSFGISSQDSFLTGVFFKDDGTKVYVLGNANDTVYQYALSTA